MKQLRRMTTKYLEESRQSQAQGKWKEEMEELTVKLLKSAGRILDESTFSFLDSKYKEDYNANNPMSFLHFFVSYLIDQLADLLEANLNLSQLRTPEAWVQDYEILQQAMQKSEAEIRKHIRIEQQCKICIDTLEQKVESLEKQLLEQQHNNSKLLDTIKALQRGQRRFEDEFSQAEVQNRNRQPNSELLNGSIHKEVFVSWKAKRSKSRLAGDKVKSKLANRPNENKLNFVESSSQIKIVSRPIFKAQNEKSMNADLRLKQLRKTVQMKAQKREGHYKTEISAQNGAKIYRSNSVCH